MIFSPFEEVEFAPIVDKIRVTELIERNPLARFERRTAAQFEMKSGNSSRVGSAPDKRVGIELELIEIEAGAYRFDSKVADSCAAEVSSILSYIRISPNSAYVASLRTTHS